MPFDYAFSPVIFSLGPFALRWYSLVYILGFLAAYWWLRKAAEEGQVKNLTKEGVESYITWLILGSILGARLFYALVYNPSYYVSNPLDIIAVWKGGMSFHGFLIGAAAATLLFCRKKKIKFYDLADLLVLPAAFFLFLGRIANLINGELIGTVTTARFCINYPGVEGCRHPSQLYAAAKNLAIFFLLFAMRKKKLRPGTRFWLFVLLYGALRFIVNFWRAADPTDPILGGLLIGQWLSLVMLVIAGWMLTMHRKVL